MVHEEWFCYISIQNVLAAKLHCKLARLVVGYALDIINGFEQIWTRNGQKIIFFLWKTCRNYHWSFFHFRWNYNPLKWEESLTKHIACRLRCKSHFVFFGSYIMTHSLYQVSNGNNLFPLIPIYLSINKLTHVSKVQFVHNIQSSIVLTARSSEGAGRGIKRSMWAYFETSDSFIFV